MTETDSCRYCGREFPRWNTTALPLHEVRHCPERPDDSQDTLSGWSDSDD